MTDDQDPPATKLKTHYGSSSVQAYGEIDGQRVSIPLGPPTTIYDRPDPLTEGLKAMGWLILKFFLAVMILGGVSGFIESKYPGAQTRFWEQKVGEPLRAYLQSWGIELKPPIK